MASGSELGMKANAAYVNGEWRNISKAPTGDSMKHSKAGRLALQYVDGDYRTVPRDSIPAEENVLVVTCCHATTLRSACSGFDSCSSRPRLCYRPVDRAANPGARIAP